MLKIKKYAAIDIGSNAMRLLITYIVEERNKPTQFNKSHLVRVPIRLGQEVFTVGEISAQTIYRMEKAMKAFKLLMDVYQVEKYAACATSAMREAYNGSDIVKMIKKKSEVHIEIIDGKKEALIISNSDLKTLIHSEGGNYLYVDVGGGSTEFTFFSKGVQLASKSFRNGTVRLLNDMVADSVWIEIEKWIKNATHGYENVQMIGSGGNINKLFKISGKAQDKPLSYSYLNKQFRYLKSLTYQERIYDLGLNPDRADVIIPALRIYVKAMKWSGAKQIFVPKIGLADGIVKAMYKNNSGIQIQELIQENSILKKI